MAINFPSSPATNDTFTGPTGLEYIFDGVKWRSFKPSEPVVGTFNANSAISLSAGGTNQNITLTPSGTGVVTIPSNVGIGTTSPSSKLELRGASPQAITISHTNGIGYGTTITSTYSATQSFSLASAGFSVLSFRPTDGAAVIGAILRLDRGASAPTLWLNGASGTDQVGLKAGTGSAGAMEFYTGATERMRITSAGNVGIGTISPLTNTTTFVSAKDPVIRDDGGYFGGGLYYDTAWKNSVASQGGWAIRNSAGVLTFYTGAANGVAGSTIAASERLRIDSAGQIGIGGANYGTSGQTIVSAGAAAAPAWGTLPVTGGGTGVTTSTGTGSNVLSAAPAFTGNTTFSNATGPQITLTGATSQWVQWPQTGIAAPTFTTSSVGTKLLLFPSIGAAAADYAIGIEGNTLWSGVPTAASQQFKWYGGTTQAMLLSGAGVLTTASSISDNLGNVRAAPIQTKSGAYVVVASDAGQTIYISTGGVTINASILAAGDMITIVNNSASNQTITAGASVTFRLAGTATTGNRTLAQYGMATFLCVVGGATPTYHCSGAGLT